MVKKILNKARENKRNLVILSLLVAILLVICFRTIEYNLNSSTLDRNSYGQNDTHVGGIWNISEIWQTITATKDKIGAFSLRFGTFSRVNEGTVTVELFLDPLNENRLVFKETVPAKDLIDNAFTTFTFDTLSGVLGKELAIRVTADGVDTLPVTLWASDTDVYKGGALFINGQQTGTDLNMQLYYQHTFSLPELLVIFTVGALIAALVYAFYKKIFIFGYVPKKKHLKWAVLGFLYITLISSVKAYVTEDAVMRYRLNVIPFLLFIATLMATVVFEKKLGLYNDALNKIKCGLGYFKEKLLEIKAERKLKAVFQLSVQLSLIASLFSFFTLVSIFFMLNLLTKASTVAVFILTLIAIASLFIKLILIDKKPDVAKIFLISVIIFTLFLCYALPPINNYIWDSEIHFARIINVKTMLFGQNDTLHNMQTEFKHIYLPIQESSLQNKDSLINLFEYVGYFPSAIVIAASDALSMNLIPTMSLAKYINALLFAFLIYSGIKKLKSGKLLFSAVALIPCNMFLASGFSYDVWVTAFITYSMACFVSELQNHERKIKAETAFLMLFAFFLGCGPKMVYFFIAVPLLFLSKDKFENGSEHKKYVFATLLTIFAIFISFALPFFADVGGIADSRGGENVNSGAQLAFILENPFRYARILFNFILQYVSIGNMSLNLVNYAYYGFSSLLYGAIGAALIIFTALTDKEFDVYPDRKKQTVVMLLASLMQIALIATALYIAYTPVMHNTVNGCQYRYMFPLLTPIFCFIGTAKFKNIMNERTKTLLVLGLCAVNIFGSVYDTFILRIIGS